jgi:hypothetical protein
MSRFKKLNISKSQIRFLEWVYVHINEDVGLHHDAPAGKLLRKVVCSNHYYDNQSDAALLNLIRRTYISKYINRIKND